MSGKKNKKRENAPKVEEPPVNYNKTITVTTLAELEDRDRTLTRNMTPEERMNYLQQLNENLYGTDLTEQINILRQGKIYFKRNK